MTRFITGAILMAMALTANAAELKLTQEWDKTFPKSEKVLADEDQFLHSVAILVIPILA